MFTPPPEGFGGEEENLPLKNVQVDAASPEQVPLLTQNHPKDTLPAQARLPVGRVDSKITQIFVYLYEKLKLKQIIQPAIISSVSISRLYYSDNLMKQETLQLHLLCN